MNKADNDNRDSVLDPLATPDGLNDAAPTDNNTPADPPVDPTDQPVEAAPPEAPGTPDATPKSKQPHAKRSNHPDREHCLLKTNRTGIGGPSTEAGKAASSMNNAQHGMYSRGPFRVMPWESQDQYDALCERMRRQFTPFDEVSEQMLDQLTQAFWRFNRCDRAEYMAETSDAADFDQQQRRIFSASSYRARCERSYYLHHKNLKQVLADYQQQQEAILEKMQNEEMEKLEVESQPKPRFNAEGEEMDPAYPQRHIWKLSCLPESRCNEVFEFDRTLKGKMSVKRTPLRDWEGGWMLHPSIRPLGMKGEWCDHHLGRYKDYYNSRKAEDIKNLNEDIKNL